VTLVGICQSATQLLLGMAGVNGDVQVI